MQIASNYNLAKAAPVTPVACRSDDATRAVQALASYAIDRMAIAMNLMPDDASALECRTRLCRFFRDFSAQARALGLDGVVHDLLDGTAYWEYPKIGDWMDGKWSSRKTPMVNLLARMRMPRSVIEAAAWLHDRGASVVTDEDDSRSSKN